MKCKNATGFITIIGNPMRNYQTGLKVGDRVTLIKEPNNPVDLEAIKIMSRNEQVAYVANSVNTVAMGTMSAGRLYDRIDDGHKAVVKFVHERVIIAEVEFCSGC